MTNTLWILAASPAIWAGHFMLCYISAAIWCGKLAGPDASLWSVRMAIVGYTVVALAAIGIIGYAGLRSHSAGSATAAHDDDSPIDRRGFIGHATLLLSGLSAMAVVYSALPAIFIAGCD
jgi:hypothetical protein